MAISFGAYSRKPTGGIPTLPTLSTATGGGVAQDRANIDQLLSGQFDPYEINMQSAERAIGSGTGGSGFAQAGRYKLLDSEKLARQSLGHQELDRRRMVQRPELIDRVEPNRDVFGPGPFEE